MKYYRIIVLLFFFLFINGCSSTKNNDYVVETVSSIDKNFDYNSAYESNNDVLMSNVIVYNKNYSKFLGIKYEQHNTYGSGFIYEEDENFYYILTNNHVVNLDKKYENNNIVIEDYFGNKYNGEVINSNIDYDLAIVKFEKNIVLPILEISSNNVKIGENIRSMGNPNSKKNIINEGKTNCYSIINIDSEDSNIKFDVLVHSATIQSGSSGGALLNQNNQVIGVTFAGVFDKDSNFVTGYAIPADKINEFLSN